MDGCGKISYIMKHVPFATDSDKHRINEIVEGDLMRLIYLFISLISMRLIFYQIFNVHSLCQFFRTFRSEKNNKSERKTIQIVVCDWISMKLLCLIILYISFISAEKPSPKRLKLLQATQGKKKQ